MAGIFSYKCGNCSRIHEGSPNYGYNEPAQYHGLSEDERKNENIVTLSNDTCTIKHIDLTDYFIRTCLEIPIIGVDDPFVWGVWVSLSERNFKRYKETYDDPVISDKYFGWFCNSLPIYPETQGLKTTVYPRLNKLHPTIKLETTDHPLSLDQWEGISIARAQEIAEQLVHREPTA